MDSELIKQRAKAFDYLFDAVVIVDLQGNITDWNQGSEKLYGYSKEEVIGKSVSLLHVPEDVESVTKEVMSSVEKTGKWSGEVKMLHKDGHIGWIESMCVPFHDSDGIVVGSLGINRDISKRVKQQVDLKKEVEIKNRFFSIIAHDLNGPFTQLFGFTNILSKKAEKLSKEKVIEMASMINNAAIQVFSLQKNLLQWSRLQFDSGKVNLKTNSLNTLVEESLEVYKIIASSKEIAIVNEITEGEVYADPDMLQTIIRNLVSNALKFSYRGGEIKITSKQVEKMVEITVSDTGTGIECEKVNNIFVLDNLSSVKGTDGESGTGIGMSLCKSMVEENGGTIWVNSVLGKGTQMSFSVPVKK
jgi:PAS domain S-box-containing protein